MTSRDGHPQRLGAARRRSGGFTLVEILMAMMVAGVILAACVSLAWALATYNNEGEAAVQLATHGRFAVTLMARDVRDAKAVNVTDTGGLLLWMGDFDDDGKMDAGEFVLYYKPAAEPLVRRLDMPRNKSFGDISVATFDLVVQGHDLGTLIAMAEAMGVTPNSEVVCRTSTPWPSIPTGRCPRRCRWNS